MKRTGIRALALLCCFPLFPVLAVPAAAATVTVQDGYESGYGIEIPFTPSPRADRYTFEVFEAGNAADTPLVTAEVAASGGEQSIYLPLCYDPSGPAAYTLQITAHPGDQRVGLDSAAAKRVTFTTKPTCGCPEGTGGAFYLGDGSAQNPYRVCSPAQLQHLNHEAHRTGGQSFLQTGDLDLSSYGDWTPIGGNGYSAFDGTYDGGGHVIRNMKISGSKEDAGLFGLAAGTIQNLGVDASCQIDTLGIRAGGLAAQIPQNGSLTVRSCYSAASVRVTAASNSVIMGGLVGHAPNVSLDMAGCYFSGSLTAASGPYRYAGGLVGYPPHSTLQIRQCYSDGTLSIGSGTIWRGVGALFGYVLGTGTGGLTSNYWQSGKGANATIGSYGDVGPASNAGGTALSTAQMAQQSSFSGFDFTNIWWWDSTANRPRLAAFDH
ncbi:hypothetical protein [Harryflintia acetispora]|uniref:hypothetical protein n=1 Tax=Harryflintia acetispora TaxID=1849041 RepID=UPI00189811C0|nr:hypothetical protein [Harryflintia acetispora]